MGSSVGPNELGAMSLKIQSEGDATVLSTLDKVDQTAKRVGSNPVGIKIQTLGTESSFAQLRALIQEISRATRVEATRAEAIATLVSIEQDLQQQMASGTLTLKQRLETAGLLDRTQTAISRSMRLVTQAAEAEKAAIVEETMAMERLEQQTRETAQAKEKVARTPSQPFVDPDAEFARRDPNSQGRTLAGTPGFTGTVPMPGMESGTAATDVKKVADAKKLLNKEINDSIRLWTLDARAADASNKTVVADLMASADAMRVWMAAQGASLEQQQRFNLSVQQFERRVQSLNAEMTKVPPTARRAAQAMTTIAIIGSTGVGSLRDFANAFGLLAATSSQLFLPEKWAGYAAGIGAAVVAVTALVLILKEKAKIENTKNFAEITAGWERYISRINVVTDLQREYAAQLEETRQAEEDLMRGRSTGVFGRFFDPFNFFQSTRRRTILDEERRQTKVIEDRLVELNKRRVLLLAQEITDISIATAQQTNQLFQASFQAQEARNKVAMDRGLMSLRDFYRKRFEIIKSSANQEIAALESERRSELGRQIEPGDTEAEIQKRSRIASLDAQIEQVRINQGKQQVDNAEQARVAELNLSQTILQHSAKLLEVRGRTHEARMITIERETQAYKLALQQEGTLTATAQQAMVDGYREALKTSEDFAESQRQVAIIQQSLAIEVERINKARELGLISDRQAGQMIAMVESSRVAVLTKIADEMERFALALKDPTLIAAVQTLRSEISNLGIDFTNPLVKARQDVNAQFDAIGTSIVSGLASSLAAAAEGGSGGEVLRKALGGIMVSVGSALMTYGAAMSGLLPALTNPFTSGPAAILAGSALVALGAKLGATLTGSTSTSTLAPTNNQPIELQRIIVDPNSEAARRISARGDRRPGELNLGTPVQIQVYGLDSQQGQRDISRARVYGKRRGLD